MIANNLIIVVVKRFQFYITLMNVLSLTLESVRECGNSVTQSANWLLMLT